MTTSVLNYADTLLKTVKPAKTLQRPPAHPFSRLISLFRQTMEVMQALPDNGRVSRSQLARARAMAERI